MVRATHPMKMHVGSRNARDRNLIPACDRETRPGTILLFQLRPVYDFVRDEMASPIRLGDLGGGP